MTPDSSQIKPDRASWIKGPSACCNIAPHAPARAWRMVLQGAPGVGKGTQAQLLSERLGACHLSTGDVFRAAKTLGACEQTPSMMAAQEYMSRGELVPDEIVLGVVRERAKCIGCCLGFILDGFPRTVAQAEALSDVLSEKSIALDAVVDYQLPLEEIVSRLSGRRTCPRCKAVYHVKARPPRVSGVCNHCAGPLMLRDDDRPESIRVRMAAYEKSTMPLTDYYRSRGLLVAVGAQGSAEDVLERSMQLLGELPPVK